MKENFFAIAMVCHEANRAYCATINDMGQVAWHQAPEWQRESALAGVRAIAEGRVTRPEQSHESWFAEKERTGWKYGPVKDVERKEHPCFVPYDQLPVEQRVKDHLFFAIATTLLNGATYGA